MKNTSKGPKSGLKLKDKFETILKYILVKLCYVNAMIDTINGGDFFYRWQDTPEEKEAIRLHRESFKKYGLLGAFPVIRVQEDFTARLNGIDHPYKKGTYCTIDYSGRLRAYKEEVKARYGEGSKEFEEWKIPALDVTEQVLDVDVDGNLEEMVHDGKLIPEIREKIWEAVITLSTGQLSWDPFQFINSGASIITNPEQKAIYKYCSDKMIQYAKGYTASGYGRPQLSNRNVLSCILGGVPKEDQIRRTRKIKFQTSKIRYTNHLLEKINELRVNHSRSSLPGPFIDVLGNYLLSFFNPPEKTIGYTGYFLGKEQAQKLVRCKKTGEQKLKWEDDITTITHAFSTDEKIYSDEHFVHFENSVNMIINHIDTYLGFTNHAIPSSGGEAKRWLYTQMRNCWSKENKNV